MRCLMNHLGVTFVQSPADASLLVGNRIPLLAELASRFGPKKQYLLWTHEPRFYLEASKWTTIKNCRVRTISLQSGEVCFDNYYYARIPTEEDSQPFKSRLSKRLKRVVCVATASRNPSCLLKRCGQGIDLNPLRTTIALDGYRQGFVDIHGRGWPSYVSQSDSRSGNWAIAKYKILTNYDFNLCFENTLFPFYCSEKIWQSIYCGCLPIYYGQKTIYEDFPRNSFIDYADYPTPGALFEQIQSMSDDEITERYNKCVKVFESARSHAERSRVRASEYAICEIHRMCA